MMLGVGNKKQLIHSPFAVADKYLDPATPQVRSDPSEGQLIAVLIDSTVLGAEIWLALSDNFQPDRDDNRAVFFADELEFLATKTLETLREIHKVKLAMGGGRVRQ